MLKKWLDIAIHIPDDATNLERFECPNCGCCQIDYLYTGNSVDKIGYRSVWCNNCLNGIRVSRVGIPDGNFKKRDFNDDKSEISVPDFKEVF